MSLTELALQVGWVCGGVAVVVMVVVVVVTTFA
jgi:hypothetical protein